MFALCLSVCIRFGESGTVCLPLVFYRTVILDIMIISDHVLLILSCRVQYVHAVYLIKEIQENVVYSHHFHDNHYGN